MSLKERCAQFVSKNPRRSLCATKLARIYAKNKVKLKEIKIGKVNNGRQRRKIKRAAEESWAQLQRCISRGFRVICLDEMMVTKSTI